ncbi:hypothetical protein Egran_00565 [Elaphomyces granulatus]|uniref:Ubiquitin-conjugating enzyme E2 2 n=1 Tax=Elaphomyces granulatus TaxID=519963 RepID=A0A232M5V2_9EURO|nr:hypothetical protein Egran_00565 [Elaphomyces granulatus]
MADRILAKEFKDLAQEKWVHIQLDNDNIYNWDVALIVLNPDSLYYGGYFKASMTFPENYPYSPPEFRFLRPLYHPNIYEDGRLCISILHTPGEDITSGESAAERWSPAQRVETVLISILSLLDDAEVSSPANVEAGLTLRRDPATYECIVMACVEASKEDIPDGFIMPDSTPKPSADNDDFFADSDEDEDVFGGSDSSTGEEMADGDDDDDEEIF